MALAGRSTPDAEPANPHPPLVVGAPCDTQEVAGCPGSGVVGWLTFAALGVNSQPARVGTAGRWVKWGNIWQLLVQHMWALALLASSDLSLVKVAHSF